MSYVHGDGMPGLFLEELFLTPVLIGEFVCVSLNNFDTDDVKYFFPFVFPPDPMSFSS